MKRVAAILLALVALAGCGGGEESAEDKVVRESRDRNELLEDASDREILATAEEVCDLVAENDGDLEATDRYVAEWSDKLNWSDDEFDAYATVYGRAIKYMCPE